jgi:lysozyme
MADVIVPVPPLLALIMKHEGCVPDPYDDSEGILTVGVGHNLVAHPLPGEVYPMSQDRMQEVLADDLQDTIATLELALPWVTELDDVRQAVLIDMAFNMGVDGLLEFKNTLAMVHAAQYQLASQNMLLSKWAQQVGQRAIEDSTMMQTGQWPS